ncbi:acyl-CoA dehydrogenase family protein [Hyphomonas sp. UBA3601]|uniref:acyl-CoA dehydrogenase family protein n=1 Tax=Hyphomonas sp. UBA3601 TaxID=1946626 RepID=UPI0032E4CFB8
MIRETVASFAQNEIAPRAAEIDRTDTFPRDLLPKMGELGLLGITVEEEWGGTGLGYLEHVVAMEEISRASASVGLSYGAHSNLCVNQLRRWGNDDQKSRYLPKLVSGEHLGALAMSESGAGSDVVSMKLKAEKKGDRYVLNGTKMWITNSPSADFFCLLANTSDDKPHVNKSLIVVPKDAGGITVDKPLNKLGMRSSETAQVFFDDVRVPQRNLIGQEGMGFMMQMMQFQEERLWGAANAIKGCENLIAQTIDYARDRQVFGMSLLDNQSVHFKLAELQTEVEMLRALVWQACETYINGGDVLRLASMAKLKAGRLSREVADGCMQYWGGNCFMWDNPASQLYRDGRLGSIGGGADEVMLGIICKTMGMLPGKKKNS